MARRLAFALTLAFTASCSAPPVVARYRVGGTVTGLEGSGLVLQLNGSDDVVVRTNGEFTFDLPVPNFEPYDVSVKTQPASPTQRCAVLHGSGALAGRNITDVEVTCATQTFAVGGTVSGLEGSGLVLRNNGGDDLIITTNGPFRFANPVVSGASYSLAVAVQPTLPTQVCSIQSGFGVVGSGAVLDLAVVCVTRPVSLGGRVTGLVGSGLVLQNNGAGDLVLQPGATSYAFTVPRDALYTVTVKTQPTSPNQSCTVANAGGTTTSSDVTNVDVTCTTDLLAVGGTVTGLSGAGLVLRDSSGTNLPVAAGATSYHFDLPSGAAYAVTIASQPVNPSQVCAVANATGTVAGVAITNVHVTCTTTAFTVGGTINGLTGTGLVLQNNGGADLLVPPGATTFSFASLSGAAYAVSVKTQPISPTQFCAASNATGTVTTANVTNLVITCATSTFTVGGTITGLVGTGLTLQNNAGSDLTPAAGATQYSFTVPSGTSYAVTVRSQPVNPSQTCAVVNTSGTVTANVTNVHVTCVTSSFTVGGTLTGLVGAGLVLRNNGGSNQTLATGSTGYTFTVASGGAYAVTVLTQPSNPTQSCLVSNASGTVTSGNVTNVNITCTTTSFTVGGAISGLLGGGLVLQNNLGADLPLAAGAGTYSFTVPSATGYSVTVKTQPTTPTQVCTVANHTGSVSNVNVTNATISCVSSPFTIGGPITGMVGTGLVLQNNGANDVTPAASATSYSFSAVSGTPYAVTVKTQPTNPTQVCTVAMPTGTVPNGDVTNLAVNCTCSPYCPRIVVLAGTKSLTAGHVAANSIPGGAWTVARLAGTTQSGTALAMLDDGTSVALVRNNVDDALKFTRWSGATWSALADVGAGVTTQGKPSLAGGATAEAVFHGVDFKHYNATFTGSWSAIGTVGSPRSPMGLQVFGPSVPVVLNRGSGNLTVAYVEDGSNRPTAIDFSPMYWQTPVNVSTDVVSTTGPWPSPSLVAPSSGPTLLMTWHTGVQFRYSTSTAGTWSAPANITSALSVDPAVMLALPGGEVLMLFRGLDNNLYALSYISNGSWGLPAQVITGIALLSSPAVAKGQGGALAEVAYVGTDGAAYHLRLAANRTWTAPVQIATSVDFVSIASGP